MVEQKIEFRKTRDFGENLNDTFLFIWLNFKPLLQSFLAICAIFMLFQAILEGLYESGYSTLSQLIFSRQRFISGLKGHFSDAQYYMIRLSKWLTFISVHVSVNAYIKCYVENNGAKPGIEKVWNMFKKYYFKVLLLSLPIIILVSLGIVLFVAPGVYLIVVLLPFSIIAMAENKSFTDTMIRSFDLIRNNFWPSFLIYCVAVIIYIVSSFFTGLIITGILGVVNFFTNYDLSSTIAVLTSFFEIFTFCFYIVVLVSVALNYYNLVEKKEGTGILNRINKIGNDMPQPGNTDELY